MPEWPRPGAISIATAENISTYSFKEMRDILENNLERALLLSLLSVKYL